MKSKTPTKIQKGFAVMSKAQRVKIATMGGKAISKNRRYMAEIGRKGGLAGTGAGNDQ